MEKSKLVALEKRALSVREHIIKMATGGGCFIGASLSCTDLIVYLYSSFLNVSKHNYKNSNRDYFFLSKGHDVPALYGTLAELGFIRPERLLNHLKTSDSIYWHPNRSVPAVEFHSGSLGHLLPVAIGVAIDLKINKQNNKVVVLTGDGELNEGSNWEAMLVANAYHLDNLLVVIDRNQFQANLPTEKLIPLEPLDIKLEAFGFQTTVINGHDFEEMEESFTQIDFRSGRPNAVIADTIRGKGLPSIEKRADRWFCNFSQEEVDSLLKELHGEKTTHLTSEALIVR